jgi:ABC-type phosphate transport system auxiliary subunit
MATIEELADRVERLLLRHEELQRTNALIAAQLVAVTGERDNLRSRLNAAKSRIDVLLQRLPRDPAASDGADGAPVDVAGASGNAGATLRSVG